MATVITPRAERHVQLLERLWSVETVADVAPLVESMAKA